MNLGRQIFTLLKRHTAVFVKGLGTFKRIRTSASYDDKRKVVLPPLSYIEFEYGVEDGYDFTLYIQQSKQIEKSLAEQLLNIEVDKIIDQIHTHGQFTLEELGLLIAYGHAFIFKPLDLSGCQFVPLQDAYRDSNIQEVAVNDQDVESIEQQENRQQVEIEEGILHNTGIINSSEEPAISGSEEKVDGIVENPTENKPYWGGHKADILESESEPSRKNNALIYALIAVLALVALGGIYYYSIITKKLDNVDNYLAVSDSLENVVKGSESENLDTLFSSVDSIHNDSLQTVSINDTVNNETPITEQELQPKSQEEKYAIVIGTHKTVELAKTDVENYHRRGYKNVRALAPNLDKNLKRVIWDSYPTKELRDSALRYVKKEIKSDAWPTVLN